MKRKITFLILLSFVLVFSNIQAKNSLRQQSYNVEWTTPSPDAWESMPLSGRYGAGANVWVQDGALWLYLAHNMAYDEEGRLMKLGALRITPANGAFNNLASFSQKLDIYTGAITINSVSKTGTSLKMKLWFADENLVIESASKQKTAFEISFGTWRDKTRDSLCIDMYKRLHTLRADSLKVELYGVTTTPFILQLSLVS
jgi:hypothetical protein